MSPLLREAGLAVTLLASLSAAACISSGDQTTINDALTSGGAGAIVQLCASATISISDTIQFTAEDQELSTEGYPTGDTRATITIASGNDISMLIQGEDFSGVRIMNLIVDGNRAQNGIVTSDTQANIQVGGGAQNMVISNVASRNPRGWSCLHVIESGSTTNPCSNATIINNDIGPCGQQGYNSAGDSLWADGISFACTDSLVSGNTIEGSTDGGIVLFGAPGTTVSDNTITSSATDAGFGAINMVDLLYNGSYANVVVDNNTITGQLLFGTGICIGSCCWSFGDGCQAPAYNGPATITNNVFAGNITFAIPINGWEDGLTVTGNDISGLTKPDTAFADDNSCSAAVQTLFEQDATLNYYPANVHEPYTLQSEFVASTDNPMDFICGVPLLPSTITYLPGQLADASNTNIAELHNNIVISYQDDNNLVVYNTTGGSTALWASGHTVASCGTSCSINFQSDGNLVTYYDGTAEFYTNTQGAGAQMICRNTSPWIEILDSSGAVIWSTDSS